MLVVPEHTFLIDSFYVGQWLEEDIVFDLETAVEIQSLEGAGEPMARNGGAPETQHQIRSTASDI